MSQCWINVGLPYTTLVGIGQIIYFTSYLQNFILFTLFFNMFNMFKHNIFFIFLDYFFNLSTIKLDPKLSFV